METKITKQIKTGWLARTIKIVLPFFMVIAGVAAAYFLYQTKPSAKRGRPAIKPPLVEVVKAVSSNHVVMISSMGTVIPSRSLALKSRVSGFVLNTSDHFVPGGIFKKGEEFLNLDPGDFKLALERKKALMLRAGAELNIEKGRQGVAKAEVELMETSLGKKLDNLDLALRKPQLAQVKADLEVVRVDVEQAGMDLERTVITAPFNCMILEKNVDQGSQVTTQESLAELVGTDEYWVEATVPVDELAWINFPLAGTRDNGSPVQVLTRDKKPYQGKVFKLLGDLAPKSRLARVLISIKDPLGLDSPQSGPLIINSYVTVLIQGKKIDNVIALPRMAARDGDCVWIIKDDRLYIKKFETLWKNAETIFVKSGIKPGDRIIISELSSAVEGMPVRVEAPGKNGN